MKVRLKQRSGGREVLRCHEPIDQRNLRLFRDNPFPERRQRGGFSDYLEPGVILYHLPNPVHDDRVGIRNDDASSPRQWIKGNNQVI
jgi:hypothetical protein